MDKDPSKDNAELVESLTTYVAGLAQLPVSGFAKADAMRILNAVRKSEANAEQRILLPALLTMVDIRLKDTVFYVSCEQAAGEGQPHSREHAADGEFGRLGACFTRPSSLN